MHGFGRELFVSVRQNVGSAEEGASLFDISGKERA
jgi:phosphogluconate dehydratase